MAGAYIATTNTLETEVNNEHDPLSRNRGQDLRDQLSSTGGIGDANMTGSITDNFKTDISKVRLNVNDTNSASGIPRIEKIKLENGPSTNIEGNGLLSVANNTGGIGFTGEDAINMILN